MKSINKFNISLIVSEATLLEMGENDYMNVQQLSFFEAKLRNLQQDLAKSTAITGGILDETELVADPIDRASNEESRQAAHCNRLREQRLLADVCNAIAKITSGDYGFCDNTGEPIGIRRLLARPTANLTIEEQSRREKQLARMIG